MTSACVPSPTRSGRRAKTADPPPGGAAWVPERVLSRAHRGLLQSAILDSFADLERAAGVPGLKLPGLDVVSIAKGYGRDPARVEDIDPVEEAVAEVI